MKIKMLAIVLLITSCFLINTVTTAQALVVYEEEFATDPGYLVVNATPADYDFFGWDSASESYRAQTQDETGPEPKFAYSPVFQKVENESFTIDVDILTRQLNRQSIQHKQFLDA